jgi:hypothetical protein
MRLEEFQPSAAERRVKRLKVNAKSARDRARQLKAQADINAERVEMQQSRDALVLRAACLSTPAPARLLRRPC